MNNDELSYKLKYILTELGMNKKEFLQACRKFSPSISKPTISLLSLRKPIGGKLSSSPIIKTFEKEAGRWSIFTTIGSKAFSITYSQTK